MPLYAANTYELTSILFTKLAFTLSRVKFGLPLQFTNQALCCVIRLFSSISRLDDFNTSIACFSIVTNLHSFSIHLLLFILCSPMQNEAMKFINEWNYRFVNGCYEITIRHSINIFYTVSSILFRFKLFYHFTIRF